MQNANPTKAVMGGFIGTLVMTMMMYAAPMMGMPKMDLAGMLGSMFNSGQPPEMMSGLWWMGMMIHFVNGTVVFALIYAYLLYGWLPGSPWLRGLTWGLILWLVSQVMVMPMMGKGVFSANTPVPKDDGPGQHDGPHPLRSDSGRNRRGTGGSARVRAPRAAFVKRRNAPEHRSEEGRCSERPAW